MNSIHAKIDKMQPMQELAFHKQQCEINGVQFYCHQSYYEGELLNGVDLKIKEVKGLDNKVTMIDYLQDSQQLIFCASSNLIVYNTHKRTYNQLFALKGQVQILKTHLEKMNNREYIIWIEKLPNQDEENYYESKNVRQSYANQTTSSRLRKQVNNMRERRQASRKDGKQLLKSLFSTFACPSGDQKEAANMSSLDEGILNISQTSKQNVQVEKKVHFVTEKQYFLKVYDYGRKQLIFENKIRVLGNRQIKDVFLFWNHFKILGYILDDKDEDSRLIYYKKIDLQQNSNQNKNLFNIDIESKFDVIQTCKKVEGLSFNNEQNNYVFYDGTTINMLKIKQHFEDEDQELFHQFFNISTHDHSHFSQLNDSSRGQKGKNIKLEVQHKVELQSKIISITVNDQYVAVLTKEFINFYSAYDIQSLIFVYNFESVPQNLSPSYIQFNKTNLMLTYKDSSSITTFTIKNKALVFTNTTSLQVNHCKQILKVFTNNISSEIFCVILFYELESRVNNVVKSKKVLQSCVQYVIKPAFIDVTVSYLSPTSKTEAKLLNISKQKFKKIHTCPWLSSYIIETEEGIQYREWKQSFDNKRCLALHPTGIFLVLCFKQSFKIYIITMEGLINTYRGDSAKDIQACAIASSGNHIAVACINSICIYDFYSCNKMKAISLPMGLLIEQIDYQDNILCCSLRNKKLYLYDMLNQYKQLLSFNPKSNISDVTGKDQDNLLGTFISYTVNQIATLVSINQIYYDPVLNFIIYSYRNTIYFYNCLTNSIVSSYEFEPISCIYFSQNLSTLFLGTQHGEIICFPWPNKPNNLLSEQRKYKFHGGRIIDIKVSSDLKELITIGADESICICSLILVQNLKRLQGLEIIEHLSGSIKVCFDILLRRGFYQYTHSKFNDKMDILKDYEDEVLNINFILPQQRLKQKEQMLSNINGNTKEMFDLNSRQYADITLLTNDARDQVTKIRDELYQFETQRDQQKERLKQNLFANYIKCYNNTQNSEQQLRILKDKNTLSLVHQKKKLSIELQKQKQRLDRQFIELENQYKQQKEGCQLDKKEQLLQIDAEKKQFIEQNVNSLSEVINEINNNNGILSCKNNNIEKEIAELKRKIEEHKYLLYRLETNTSKLQHQQIIYDKIKKENSKLVEKEDKINLTQIEKRYVKQTQLLIEKDKEIGVKIVNYEKQKNILIYLEKCLEEIETNIEGIVEHILEQKKERKEQVLKISQISNFCKNLNNQCMERKKDKISNRNQFKNYICRLQSVVDEIVSTSSNKKIIEIFMQRDILDKSYQVKQAKVCEEKEILQKIMSAKIYNINKQSNRTHNKIEQLRINRTADNQYKNYRKFKTEGKEEPSANKLKLSPSGFVQSSTCRDVIQKRSKRIFYQLSAEQKHYERIKTEQVVYENTRKKFNLENQDLIENYNSLAMQNKRIMNSLKKQDLLTRNPVKIEKSLKNADSSSTPFLLYLQNKACTQRVSNIPIPTKVYEY